MMRIAACVVIVCLLVACGSSSNNNQTPPPTGNGMTISIGNWSVCVTINELCTSVTVCQSGTDNCQTISDVLVDIGSVGLRVFGSVLSTPLSPIVDGQGRPIGECTFFADGSSTWGPVQMADVVLDGTRAVRVPIQVIVPTFGGQTASNNPCNDTVDATPDDANLNGILGVGVFRQDCGSVCAANSNNTLYFACAGGTCAGTSVPLSNQVQNPVWLMPSGNNGVVLSLPNVPTTGAPVVSGTMMLGIESAAGSTPVAAIIPADGGGFVTTIYKGRIFTQSIIDSGSNGLFFPDASLPTCAAPLNGFYCPPNTVSLSGTIVQGNGQTIVPFTIANTNTLVGTGNAAFNDLGGDLSTFDWGLPFFLGRTVFIGIEDQPSSLGPGPFFAF